MTVKIRVWPILAVICGLLAPFAKDPVWAVERAITPKAKVHMQEVDRKGDNVSADNAETVLILGSSIAAGWRDELGGGGFLERAFHAISAVGNTRYNIVNKSIPGEGVTHIVDKYPTWIKNRHPDIVVLAWGGLDDAHDKTPISEFRAQLQAQIQAALDNHAVVFVVTPPVSKASYTQYSTEQPNLLNNEMEVAKSFHNPNVYIFDVFDQMKAYLEQHNETYVPYMADGWHPNALGHILAAQLLTTDFFNTFGVNQVKFDANRTPVVKKKAAVH
jgi:acyl-CoA thioesterase I